MLVCLLVAHEVVYECVLPTGRGTGSTDNGRHGLSELLYTLNRR